MSKHLPNIAAVTLGFNTPAGVPTQTLGGSDGNINVRMKPGIPFWEVIDQLGQIQLQVTNPSATGAAVVKTFQQTIDDGTGKATFQSLFVGTTNAIQGISTLSDVTLTSQTNGQTVVWNSTSSKWVNGSAASSIGVNDDITARTISGAALNCDGTRTIFPQTTYTQSPTNLSLNNGATTTINTFTIPSDYYSGTSMVITISHMYFSGSKSFTAAFGSLSGTLYVSNTDASGYGYGSITFTAAQLTSIGAAANQGFAVKITNNTGGSYGGITVTETLTYANSSPATVVNVTDKNSVSQFSIKAAPGGAYTIKSALNTFDDSTGKATFVSAFVGTTNLVQGVSTLSDATITSPTTGQPLVYNGTTWINGNDITTRNITAAGLTFDGSKVSLPQSTYNQTVGPGWLYNGTNTYTFTIPADYGSGVTLVLTISNVYVGSTALSCPFTFGSLSGTFSLSATGGYSSASVTFTTAQLASAFTAGQNVNLVVTNNSGGSYGQVNVAQSLTYNASIATVVNVVDKNSISQFSIKTTTSGNYAIKSTLNTFDDGSGKATFQSAFVGTTNLVQGVSTLKDVAFTGLADGNVMVYNGTSSTWVNTPRQTVALNTAFTQVSGTAQTLDGTSYGWEFTNTGTITVTLPAASSAPNRAHMVVNKAGGTLTITPSGTDAIYGSSPTITAANTFVRLVSNGINCWYAS